MYVLDVSYYYIMRRTLSYEWYKIQKLTFSHSLLIEIHPHCLIFLNKYRYFHL